jgi:hypothetical protein
MGVRLGVAEAARQRRGLRHGATIKTMHCAIVADAEILQSIL